MTDRIDSRSNIEEPLIRRADLEEPFTVDKYKKILFDNINLAQRSQQPKSRENKTDLCALKKLISPNDDSSDEEKLAKQTIRYGPGEIGPKKKKNVVKGTCLFLKSKRNIETRKMLPTNSNDIWKLEEVPDATYVEDLYDPRPQPEYEIHFKQDVSAEDMFLQMGPKNATTACCEYLVVAVKLPDTTRKEIKLDVKEQFLDLRTKKFKLGLHLPNPVKPEYSKAKWMPEKFTLEITLLNNREFDFMNF